MIRLAAEKAMAGRPPIDRPVIVMMAAVFDIPKSFSKKRRAAALEGGEFPAKKPDLDNILKALTDAMNGVVVKDDCQIVSVRSSKVYGPAPLVSVTVTPL
jgi:Holliday junction resolvase RusA-like endonuclease